MTEDERKWIEAIEAQTGKLSEKAIAGLLQQHRDFSAQIDSSDNLVQICEAIRAGMNSLGPSLAMVRQTFSALDDFLKEHHHD